MTIFEINSMIDEFIANNYDEETGEILNIEEFDRLQMLKSDKIENIALYYKNVSATAKALKEEKQNLADRQQKAERKAERLKEFLTFLLDGKKFETPKVSVSYRKSDRIVIDDADAIPDGFISVRTERIPDKAMIKEALKNGTEVTGCHIESINNVQVK